MHPKRLAGEILAVAGILIAVLAVFVDMSSLRALLVAALGGGVATAGIFVARSEDKQDSDGWSK